MKQIFDDTMDNIKAQNRYLPDENVQLEATKQADHVFNHGKVRETEL